MIIHISNHPLRKEVGPMWLVYSKSKEEVLWKNNVKLEKTHLKDQVRTAIVNKTPSLPFRRVSENCLIIWNYHVAAKADTCSPRRAAGANSCNFLRAQPVNLRGQSAFDHCTQSACDEV